MSCRTNPRARMTESLLLVFPSGPRPVALPYSRAAYSKHSRQFPFRLTASKALLLHQLNRPAAFHAMPLRALLSPAAPIDNRQAHPACAFQGPPAERDSTNSRIDISSLEEHLR